LLRLGAAEDRAQEAALLGLAVITGAGFELPDTLFQLLDVVGRRLQALFLHDDGLRQIVGGGGLRAGRFRYQRFGFRIARCCACGADAIEKGGQQLAFFR